MKKVILGLLVVASFAACKKSDSTASCPATAAGITGKYKLTKFLAVTTAGTVDVTSTLLTACNLGGVYDLQSSGTLVYTEAGTCAGSGTGTWSVTSGKLTSSTTGDSEDVTNATIVNNCSTVTLTEDLGGGNSYVFTFTKQ